jgi:hypothetical protein
VPWWSWIPGDLDGNGVASNPLVLVLLAVILGDPDWFKILRVGFLSDVGGEGGEAVVVVVVMVPVVTVPSSCLNETPRVAAIIDLLPKINRGSMVKAGLGWRFDLRPCVAPVARCASGLLYLLLNVATRGLRALDAVAIVVPPVPGPPPGVRLICAVSPLRSDLEGMFWVEDTGCCPLNFTNARWVRYCNLCIWGLGGNC